MTQVSDEHATADVGAAVDLSYERLVDGSDTVADPSTGETYERGVDYDISYVHGELTALPDGAMQDGTEYAIDYQHKAGGPPAR